MKHELVKQVKSLLPFFASIQKWSNDKIVNFDYGNLYAEGIWEATLVLWNGVHIEFTANSVSELYDQVEETVEVLKLN